MTTSLQQQHILSSITNNMVTTCTNLCTDNKTTIQNRIHDIILKLGDKLYKADTKTIGGNNTSWSDLSSIISKTHAQLVKINNIAIKNNNILEAKLNVSALKVKEIEEITALQLASILNLESTLQDIEKYFSSVSTTLTPEYLSTVD